MPALSVWVTMSPLPALAGETATLFAHPSGGSGGYTCTWDFGETGPISGCTVSYAWSAEGTHRITLTLVDSAGHRNETAWRIPVRPVGASGFAGSPSAWALVALLVGGVAFHVWRWTRKPRDEFASFEAFLQRERNHPSRLLPIERRRARWIWRRTSLPRRGRVTRSVVRIVVRRPRSLRMRR